MLKELGKRIVLLDGAMGTQLQARGLAPGELPETWNLTRPEDVQAIHEAYLAAGADVVTTNTFGANALKYGEDAAAVVRAGVEIARAAVRKAGRGLVALDLGPTGRLLRPYGDLDFADAVALYAQAAEAGRAAGADLALVETMSDAYELKAAVLAAKEAGLPVLATVTLDEAGRLLSGADVQVVAALLEGLGVMAMGMNCGLGPREMLRQMAALRAATDLPLLVQPNAGLPREEGGVAHYNVSPEEFAAAMAEICGAGAWMVGGCCGTTPAHIAAMAAACRSIAPKPLPKKAGGPVVTSGSRAVDLSRAPIVIGERINPTGKPRLKRALRSRDIGLLQQEAVQQAERGADVLDVNVGLPDIDEEALLPEAVQAVQAVCDLPVQIDTASPAAMEAALRRCNGIPLLNSVSGKRESLEKVLPLAKKYGGVVVGLLLDEGGIPETAEGRVEIARRIVRAAEDLGIPRRNLVLDALTMTISTGSDNARVTLEALRRCKQELGVHTVLGVSNISFGLPQRETVNAAFLTMALAAGLDAAILNPMSEAMMRAFRASLALTGADAQCGRYIAFAAEEQPKLGTLPAPGTQPEPGTQPKLGPQPAQSLAQTAPTPAEGLSRAVEQGLKDAALACTQACLDAGEAPLRVIEGQLMPALDRVGARFEAGTLFLPQLLMSAEAAKAAFALLQAHMSRTGGAPEKKGAVVLATVQGDIHDIGKNIVKVLLENYGFDVVDLGKDVAPEAVLAAVQAQGIRLVGLSALMTTTVRSMEQTIALLRREAPDCRVMVGGAVLNEEYARRIGADFYGKDAMASVGYAQRLFSGEGEGA